MEDALTTDFWDILLWSFWFFIWIAAFTFWFRCLFDLFGDSTLNGWAKAGWACLMIFIPWIGALIYLIVRGRSMQERRISAITEQQAAQDQYIKEVAGASNPASQIADAKALMDAGAISQAEFDALKIKVLA